MVLGKNGEVIGKIGIAARAQLQEYLQNAVHLIVNVKVDRKNRH
jgi:GTPase Era involved in 16S rRNA processing